MRGEIVLLAALVLRRGRGQHPYSCSFGHFILHLYLHERLHLHMQSFPSMWGTVHCIHRGYNCKDSRNQGQDREDENKTEIPYMESEILVIFLLRVLDIVSKLSNRSRTVVLHSQVMEFKSAGDAAFASKNWAEAVTQYSAAISSSEEMEGDFQRKVYSNRSAVYCSQKNFTAALLDGEKCVELDSEWAKGYVRRGDALFGLRRFTEAANAYNRADTLAADQGYAAKAQLCVDARSNEEARAHYAQQQQNAQAGRGMGMTAPSTPQEGVLRQAYSGAEMGLYALMVMYMLPLSWIPIVGGYFPSSATIFRLFLLCAVTVNALHIYCTTGRPQFNQAYLQRVLQVQGVHGMFLSIILFAGKPYGLAGLALALNQVVCRSASILTNLAPTLAQAKMQLPTSMMAQYGPQLDQMAQMASTPQGQQGLRSAVANASCLAEVLQGIALIVELAFPSRNLLFLYLWWQYLLMRTLMDQTGSMKGAFASVDGQFTTVTSHSMCPAVLGNGYAYLRTFLVSQLENMKAQSEGRATGGGGIMDTIKSKLSSCTIS